MSRLRAAVRRLAPRPVVRAVHGARRPGPDDDPRRTPYRYVFVVTYGRSGSTLIQGLLNSLPRTLVRGENNFYVLHLFRAWADLRSFRQLHLKHNPKAVRSAFYGLHEIRPASLVAATRSLLTSHMLGSVRPRQVDVLGFKEVLWHRIEEQEVPDFFDFLERVFPHSLYVLNERSHEQVVGSGFWQGQERGEVLEAIERVEEMQDFLRRTRPDRTLDLRYELVTSDDAATSEAQLRALATFVSGTCDDETLVTMRETLATGHGPFPFGKSRGRRERRRSG